MHDSENGGCDGGSIADEIEMLQRLSLEDRLLLEAIACTGWPLQTKLAFLSNHDNRDLVYQTGGFYRQLNAILPKNSVRLRRRVC